MSLKPYQYKRDFRRTPEPKAQEATTGSGYSYVIHKHAARRLHYDLRLELDGVLKSWAVPKGPSLDPSEKRLAVQVEDHPIDYASFEGIIPPGQYGAGAVMVWDRGEWEPAGNPQEGLAKGRLTFRLHGEKLRGEWTLARMSGEAGDGGKNWLLIKKRDAEAHPTQTGDILEDQPLSVLTGRSLEEIREAGDKAWVDPSKLTGARKSPQPKEFRPQLTTLVEKPPAGEQWLHEIKYDGYRLVCILRNGKARLLTRSGNDWTRKFSEIARAVEKLPIKQAIRHGEAVVLTPDGVSDFQALQNVLSGVHDGTLIYYVFDIAYCQGYDLTATPLIERKEFLKPLLEGRSAVPTVRFGDYIRGQGSIVSEQACQYGLEGIISKRADSGYIQARSRSWVKVKCLKRQEFVIGGYTGPSGARRGFGALILGYYDAGGNLIHCGRVGTGFNEETLDQIYGKLRKREREKPVFANPPTGREARGVHWVEPELVAEVEFGSWTREGVLRQASFKGLREDKLPSEVRLTKPESNQRRGKAMRGVKIAGVKLTNPDRVLYPELGFTKTDLSELYEQIAEWILPHITHRPLTLVRCPEGYDKECFYQKHLDDTMPENIRGVRIKENDTEEVYVVIRDLPGLISLVQMGVLEIHPWGCRDDQPERPDLLVFDLDPGPGVAWEDVNAGARLLHDYLSELGLQSFVKTSGGKGLHVLAPLVRRSSWRELKAFARAIAEDIARSEPSKYVATMSKAKREGRIFIDYVRNSRGATNVAAYSTRARKGAPISTPLAWDELSSTPSSAVYTVKNLLHRLRSLKRDPWEGFFSLRQSITKQTISRMGPLFRPPRS
ncbi:MAG: DNA ligase D [Candidatus Lindowbacteria bacterium]|nr:DNA ligase D [Candidatus Lindowbacteria bacterium]